MKKLAIWLILVLMMGCAALAEGDYEYALLEDGTAQITRYTGADAAVVVPGEIDGHAVSAIGDAAFRGCREIEEIVLPDGVTSIGDEAFFRCNSLETLALPQGVETIGARAFYDCASLVEVSLPSGLASIGEEAFYWCYSLPGIALPYLGPVISCAITLLVTIAAGGASGTLLLAIIIAYLIYNGVIEQFILYPAVIGDSLGLSTLETIIVVLLGAVFAGIPGMIFALPTASVAKFIIPQIYHGFISKRMWKTE